MFDYPGELKTTVSIDGNSAAENKALEFYPATKKTVVDTVEDLNLFKGAEYTLTGSLMKVEEEGATPISTVSKKFTASEEGNGVETIEFTNINLEENAKYVVFEKVESVNEHKFNHGKQEKHIVKHENINDKAQTILINQDVPEKPEKPEKPEEAETTAEKSDKKPLPKTSLNPKTGDFFNYRLYVSLLVLAGSGLFLLARKYKKAEE